MRSHGKRNLIRTPCFSVKDLAVNGSDLIALGFSQGKIIGTILQFLLDAVIDETCKNEKKGIAGIFESKQIFIYKILIHKHICISQMCLCCMINPFYRGRYSIYKKYIVPVHIKFEIAISI